MMDKDSDVAESSSKVRLVSADSQPPPWAHVLFEKISALETRISQLHINDAGPRELPETLSSDGFSLLSQHAALPELAKPALDALADFFPKIATGLSYDELKPFEDAYQYYRLLCTSEVRSGSSTPRSSRKHGFFGPQNQYYRTRANRVYNTLSQPPPSACRKCGSYHWANTACQKNGAASSSRGRSLEAGVHDCTSQ